MYNEIPPRNELKQYVKAFWTCENEDDDYLLQCSEDGEFDLLICFYEKHRVYLTEICDKSCQINIEKGIDAFGIRFTQKALDTFFNVSVWDIKNKKKQFERAMFKYDTDSSILYQTKKTDELIAFFEAFFLRALTFETRRLVADFLQCSDFQDHVQELARNMGVSQRYLMCVLTEQFGTDTKVYVGVSRFLKAKKMLQYHFEFPTIVCECGYEDQTQLYKEYKKYTGKSIYAFEI